MEWSAKIISVSNGYRVIYRDSEGSKEYIYSEKDDAYPGTDKAHIATMLYDIIEFFNEGGSKHDKKRLKVEFKEVE